jgi:hypothetical protein
MKRDWLFVACEGGHDWRSIGGCNAACHRDCCCSVPVNFCRRCGDCDYGVNAEAEDVRVECALKYGPPAERFRDDVGAVEIVDRLSDGEATP